MKKDYIDNLSMPEHMRRYWDLAAHDRWRVMWAIECFFRSSICPPSIPPPDMVNTRAEFKDGSVS